MPQPEVGEKQYRSVDPDTAIQYMTRTRWYIRPDYARRARAKRADSGHSLHIS